MPSGGVHPITQLQSKVGSRTDPKSGMAALGGKPMKLPVGLRGHESTPLMTGNGWFSAIAPSSEKTHCAGMSIYRKSVLFMVWVLFVFVTFPIWIEFLLSAFGEAGALVGGAFWLSHGLVLLFVYRCPSCRRSLFMRDHMISVPWPAKTCSKCGYNLAAIDKAT